VRLVAIREIRPGETITLNYNATEWEMASPFQCSCASTKCLGRIAGFVKMSNQDQLGLDDSLLSDFIRDKKAEVTAPDFKRPLRVCVLRSSYEGSVSDFKEYNDYDTTPAHYMQGCTRFSFESVAIKKATAFSHIRDLVKSKKYDVFFNLCDGSRDEDRAGVEVVQALEHFSAAFTGSDSKHYEQTKLEMKLMAFYAGIAVPAFAHVTSREQIAPLCAKLRFPVIVKHISGYNSIGMTQASKCANMEELVSAASGFLTQFHEALVEEFIEGIEVSVLACEGSAAGSSQTFCPVQIRFPPGETFKHFDLKWKDYEDMQCSVVQDPDLDSKCRRVGQLAFDKILGGVGYGRSDLRIDAAGNVYFLEINANCGIFYPPDAQGTADIILAKDPAQASGFASLMIDAALARSRERASRTAPVQMAFSSGEERAAYAVNRDLAFTISTLHIGRARISDDRQPRHPPG
jgi:D-alanine-D-alanine ligase-like ATP-grasp enzyme